MAEITKLRITGKRREVMKHKPIDKIRVTGICRTAFWPAPAPQVF